MEPITVRLYYCNAFVNKWGNMSNDNSQISDMLEDHSFVGAATAYGLDGAVASATTTAHKRAGRKRSRRRCVLQLMTQYFFAVLSLHAVYNDAERVGHEQACAPPADGLASSPGCTPNGRRQHWYWLGPFSGGTGWAQFHCSLVNARQWTFRHFVDGAASEKHRLEEKQRETRNTLKKAKQETQQPPGYAFVSFLRSMKADCLIWLKVLFKPGNWTSV